MKAKIVCLILIFFEWTLQMKESTRSLLSSSLSVCKSCQNTSGSRWCKSSRFSSLGECCLNTDLTGNWDGTTYNICSNDPKIKENGGILLCPLDIIEWGYQDISLLSSNNSTLISGDNISSLISCYYKISATVMNQVKIEAGKLFWIILDHINNWRMNTIFILIFAFLY